jgi:hypothetical protein
MIRGFILIVFALFYLNVRAADFRFINQFNFGISSNIFLSQGQTFPGIRFFAGASVTGFMNEHTMLNYGLSVAMYYKSIGNNLNPLVRDIQFDLTNSIDLGIAGNKSDSPIYIRTLGNSPYYNFSFDKELGAFVGTNFIFNSSRRHQTVGVVGLLSRYVSVVYYNDGAVPFNKLGLADCFDRWWTGGGCIYIHSDKGFNYAEFGFDQFTGFSPLRYELAGVIGINIPSYDKGGEDVSQINNDNEQTFNTSAYYVRIFPQAGYSIDFGVAGALRRNGYYYAVQDIIHIKTHAPLHPNHDRTRVMIGGTYYNINPIVN